MVMPKSIDYTRILLDNVGVAYLNIHAAESEKELEEVLNSLSSRNMCPRFRQGSLLALIVKSLSLSP